eukprot:1154836-Pelagomonas_calceolata.AAC.2
MASCHGAKCEQCTACSRAWAAHVHAIVHACAGAHSWRAVCLDGLRSNAENRQLVLELQG